MNKVCPSRRRWLTGKGLRNLLRCVQDESAPFKQTGAQVLVVLRVWSQTGCSPLAPPNAKLSTYWHHLCSFFPLKQSNQQMLKYKNNSN